MTPMMGSMRSMMQDASVVKQKVKPGTANLGDHLKTGQR